MGGSDAVTNLVELYPEEHVVAHLLLVKINPGHNALVCAANMMTSSNAQQHRVTNKTYGWIRRQHARVMSERMSGEHNPQFGKTRSEETRRRISEARRGQPSPMKGKRMRAESKEKMRQAKLGKYDGEKNPRYGTTHSDTAKEKMRQAKLGKYDGEKNPRYGVKLSDEAKKAMRDRNLKTWRVFNITTQQEWIIQDLDVFCVEHGLVKGSMQDVARARKRNPSFNYTYRKEWICEYYTDSVA